MMCDAEALLVDQLTPVDRAIPAVRAGCAVNTLADRLALQQRPPGAINLTEATRLLWQIDDPDLLPKFAKELARWLDKHPAIPQKSIGHTRWVSLDALRPRADEILEGHAPASNIHTEWLNRRKAAVMEAGRALSISNE
jgi:hypothetical protein